MEMMGNYMDIMIRSLEKKNGILEQMLELNEEQGRMLAEPKLDEEAFRESVRKKSEMVEEIRLQDAGFEKLYERVKSELLGNRDKYREEIQEMKHLVALVMDHTVSVRNLEERNKTSLQNRFWREKQEIRQAKKTTRAAASYLKSSGPMGYVEPQFMDRKK